MKVWKIKHIPTGLFFSGTKSRKVNGRYIKTNLLKTGKIYTFRPTEKQIKSWYRYFYDGRGIIIRIERIMEQIEVIQL